MFGNAADYDVRFRVNLGESRADMGALRSEWSRTTGSMSSDALRLAVAQEKLDRVLASSSADSLRAKEATLRYRTELEALAAQSSRTGGALASEERSLGRVARGAIAGSGALGSLRRAAVFASSSFLGGYGLVYAIRSTVDAARSEEVALGHLQVALGGAGHGWSQYGGQVETALQHQMRISAFTKTELTETLAAFVRRFGDVNTALHANAIAADVARAKNISLADAATLVMRGSFGNPRSLRILGIELTKTSANMEQLKATTKHATAEQLAAAKAADQQANETAALRAIQGKYHGDLAKFLHSSAGKQALFDAELERSKEIIGGDIVPTLDQYLTRGDRWLEQMNQSGRLQHDVNGIVSTGATVVHDLGDAWQGIEPLLHAATVAFGGTGHALTVLFELMVARKVLAFGQSFVTAGGEAAAAGRRISASLDGINVAGAEAKIAELQAQIDALHGKTVVVNMDTVVGRVNAYTGPGGVSAAETVANDATKLGVAGFLKKGLSAGGKFLRGAAGDLLTAAVLASLVPGSKKGQQDLNQGAFGVHLGALGKLPFVGGAEQQVARAAVGLGTAFDHLVGALSPAEERVQNAKVLAKILPQAISSTKDLASFNSYLAVFGLPPVKAEDYARIVTAYFNLAHAATTNPRGVKGGFFPKPGSASYVGPDPTKRGAGGGHHALVLGLSYAQSNALLRAQATPGTGDDRRVLEGQLAILNSALGQHGLTQQEINGLLSARNGVLSQIQSIDDTNKQRAAEAERKRREAAKKALAAEQHARRKRIERLTEIPAQLRIEEANAIANNASEQRLVAIYEQEKKTLEQQVKTLKAIGASKDDIAKLKAREAEVQKKINAATKKKTADSGANIREFLQSFENVLAADGPNYFLPPAATASKNIPDVHFHYDQPTPDLQREARQAKLAVQVAFE